MMKGIRTKGLVSGRGDLTVLAIEGFKEIRDDDRVGHGGSVVLIRKFDHLGQWVQSGKTVGECAVVGRAVLADQAPDGDVDLSQAVVAVVLTRARFQLCRDRERIRQHQSTEWGLPEWLRQGDRRRLPSGLADDFYQGELDQ